MTTQERQNQVEKKERFCLHITTFQIGLTTQERQQGEKKGKVLHSDNISPNWSGYPRETEPVESGDKTGRKKKKYWFFPH